MELLFHTCLVVKNKETLILFSSSFLLGKGGGVYGAQDDTMESVMMVDDFVRVQTAKG